MSSATCWRSPASARLLMHARHRRRQDHTYLGERYRRLVRRRGNPKAQVAVARSIPVITWHLLADPTARYDDFGSDSYDKISTDRKTRNLGG